MLTKLMTLTLVSTMSIGGFTANWKSFTPEQGGMKILVPTEPTYTPSTVDTAAGKVQMHTYVVQDVENKNSYALILSDFPAQAVTGFTFEQKHEVLDGVKSGFLQGSNGKQVSEKKLRVGQHPGKEILAELPNGNFMRVRFFMVNERVYQIGAVGTRENVQAGAADEFLKSFRLVNGK